MFGFFKNVQVTSQEERRSSRSEDQAVRKIVMFQSQGNVSLQRGLFVTSENIEENRRRLFAK